MILLQERKDNEARKRVYRAVYDNDVSLKWTFTLDTEGKILDLNYDWE